MKIRYRTFRTAALIGLASSLVAAAPREARVPAREFDSQGYRVRLDVSGQKVALDIPQDFRFEGGEGESEAPISPTLQGISRGFVSASMLAQKAKQFDDGLCAAVELAAEGGEGRFRGKAAMLRSLSEALAGGNPSAKAGDPRAIVLAACRLGKLPIGVPPASEAAVEATIRSFLADRLHSKPIGFFTWSIALEDIFRQDRMLQSELEGRAEIEALVRALHALPEARAAYAAYESLASRLTNPPAVPDLLALLAGLDRGTLSAPERGVAFFAPSRAHETDLVMELYGDRPIPEGFNLVEEMIRRIRAGRLDLRPSAKSGWYDYQTWALEPLVTPDRTPEAANLELREPYRKQLLELFKGILALSRETHTKQLWLPSSAAMAPEPKVIITVRPGLTAEPLATYYARRAESYRFVRTVLEEAFGAEALRGLYRITAKGPVALPLGTELDRMIDLFQGAHATACRQVGIAPEERPGPGRPPAAGEVFGKWSEALASDPDLGQDSRMMVPVFYDLLRRKTKVWAFLGWSSRPLRVSYDKPPAVIEVLKDGRKVERDLPEVRFEENHHELAYPVTAEVYVSYVLNRDEFRRHCDRYKTRAAILANLR